MFTIMVEDFHTLFKTADSNKEEISKIVEDMNKINRLDWLDIYKSLHPTNGEYPLLYAINRAFTEVLCRRFMYYIIKATLVNFKD